MLIPSEEIQKQVSMQLYPIIQNAITTIFQMAKIDPDAAKSQLKSFESFLKQQKVNIFDYIPKDLFDKIMQGQMQMPMQGMPIGPDGAPVTQPQAPEEMSKVQPPIAAGFDASMRRSPNLAG